MQITELRLSPTSRPPTSASGSSGLTDRFAPSEETASRPLTRQELVRKLFNGSEPVQELRVDWQAKPGGRLLTRAGVGPDGSLAFVNDDRLVVLRPDGSEKSSQAQGERDVFNIFLAPVVHSGGVLAAGKLGLTSFDATGAERWHHPIGEMKTRPAVAADGTVFAAAGDEMHAFDAAGKKLWSTSLRPQLVELYRRDREEWAEGLRADLLDPDKAEKKEVLESLLAGAEKELRDPNFGKDVQVVFEGGPSLGPDGRVYCFTQVGPLFCLDSGSGQVEWMQKDPRTYLAEDGVAFTPAGDLLGVTGNSLLQVIAPDGKVRYEYGAWLEKRLDQATPEEANEARRSGNMASCGLPALSPDGQAIYWAGRDGKVRAVDLEGNKLWTAEVPHRDGYAGEMDVSVGRDGLLYCANSKGLSALSPEGELLWRYETNDKYAYATLSEDKVILNTYSGEVFCLDCASLSDRARSALNASEPASRIAVANGWVTVGGVRVKQKRSGA